MTTRQERIQKRNRILRERKISRRLNPTYTAFYQDDHSCIIYRNKTNDGSLAKLPQKAVPANDPRSTYSRTDGGDPFEFALFVTNLGQLIIVVRD